VQLDLFPGKQGKKINFLPKTEIYAENRPRSPILTRDRKLGGPPPLGYGRGKRAGRGRLGAGSAMTGTPEGRFCHFYCHAKKLDSKFKLYERQKVEFEPGAAMVIANCSSSTQQNELYLNNLVALRATLADPLSNPLPQI